MRLLQSAVPKALTLAIGRHCDYNDQSRTIPGARTLVLACPYFMPVAKLENGCWPHPARLPLGCGWSGHCMAPGHEQATPSQEILESFCNLGYAGNCTWAPADRICDAVRFAVVAPPKKEKQESSEDPRARVLRLAYIYEYANRPAGQGQLEFDLRAAVWLRRHEDARIQKMAECFLESYLKKI